MAGRAEIQRKTFTRWVNTHLADRNLKCEDLATDLQDGVLLLHLLEIISGKKIKKWKKKPKRLAQKHENLSKAIKFIKGEGIKMVNIGGKDVFEGNLKIILGLIWTLILRYQINKETFLSPEPQVSQLSTSGVKSPVPAVKSPKKVDSAKKDLLNWVNEVLKPYGKHIKNFKKNWKNPQILCSLCDSLRPGLIDLDKIAVDASAADEIRTKNIQEAMKKAELHFEIPQLMDASDMALLPDELSVMSYVSYFRDKCHELERKALAGGTSYVEGPGLETGSMDPDEPREFTVHALNHEGHPMVKEGKEPIVEITIVGPEENDVKCDIADPTSSHPGAHVCKYVADKEGTYTVTVKIQKEILMDFPKKVMINPAQDSDLKSCTFTFTIHGYNDDDEKATEGGDLFEVELKNDKGDMLEVETKDNDDGSYTAAYTVYPGHIYEVYADLNGEPLANTPYIHDMRTEVDKGTYSY